jgi:hypothetical protein
MVSPEELSAVELQQKLGTNCNLKALCAFAALREI